jgi:hypothetical protein
VEGSSHGIIYGTEEHHEIFVRIIIVLAKVQNEHFPEASQKHYWANQLAWCYFTF